MLKKILIALAILVVLVVVVGLVLPGTYRVERSTLIHAPPEVIHGFVADLERWREWTPWRPESTAGTQWMFGGSRGGVGAVRSWSGEHGVGTLSLTRSDPRMGVAYDTSLEGGRYLMHGRISFTPSDAGTRVTWAEEGSVGANPFMHYLLPLIESRLGARFDEGLAQLQKRAEASPPPMEVKVEQAPAPTPTPVATAPAPSGESTPTPAPVTAQEGATPDAAVPTPDAGGVATSSPDASTPPASEETAAVAVPAAASGTEPTTASTGADKEAPTKEAPAKEAPAKDSASGESAPASPPVAGQAVPP